VDQEELMFLIGAIPLCYNNTVIYSVNNTTYIGNQYYKFGDMFRFTGTIIRPNTKTQNWYIQPVCTLWDPILFTNYIDIKVRVFLLVDVLKYIYIYKYIHTYTH
jgi:hypothetical protein